MQCINCVDVLCRSERGREGERGRERERGRRRREGFCDHDPFTPCSALIVSMYSVEAREGGREREGERERERKEKKRGVGTERTERERVAGKGENSNSKTLSYKDCSLGLVKNLSNN